MTGRAPVVAVTRDEQPDGRFARRLSALGATVLCLPTVAIEAPADLAPLDAALEALASFDWLAFTSANGFAAVAARPAWPRAWSASRRPRLAAVGPDTARALADAGLASDVVPAQASGATLAAALGAGPGARVLWPRSSAARPEFAGALQAAGAELVAPIAYCTRPLEQNARELGRRVLRGDVDAVTFLSPSSVLALAGVHPARSLSWLAESGVVIGSIGPTTSESLRRLGAAPTLESPEPSAAALAEALVEHLDRKARS